MEKSNPRIEMLKQFLSEDPQDDFSQYALALELEKAGKSSDAIVHLEQIISRNPEYLAAYYQLGNLLGKLQNPDKAITIFQQGMSIAVRQKNLKTMNELQSAIEMLDQ